MPKLEKMKIEEFRQFKNIAIEIGSMITVVAGRNGTGKSTILGLIGNCVEYKRPNVRKTTFLKRRVYRTDFNEIFKGTRDHDPTGSEKMLFYFDDGDARFCRITWQKYNNIPASRFRIIPYKKDPMTGIRKDSKKEIPAIYLGLSRLYPFGESAKCECDRLSSVDDEAPEWITSNMRNILTIIDSVSAVDVIHMGEAVKKTGVGFTTEKYGPLSNSAGQDNIGQILSAIWNIRVLKDELGAQFPGAILLIDEIDATLHPASQRKLLDVLTTEARDIGFQIVFTTHSLYLLELIIRKTRDSGGTHKVNYLTTARGCLECLVNPSLLHVENDLQESTTLFPRKIKTYCEDKEAQWFLKGLLEFFNYSARVQLMEEVAVGCDSAITLCKADPVYFKSVIMVFDGDVEKDKAKNMPNLICLPGGVRPEEVFMNFLLNSNASSEFTQQYGAGANGLTFQNMVSAKNDIERNANRIKSITGRKQRKRDLYKKWFNENKSLFDEFHLLSYWIKENDNLVKEFQEAFKKAFNEIASKQMINPI